MEPPNGPFRKWITASGINSGAGLNDDTPPGTPPVGTFASPSVWPMERAKCLNSIGWPAPRLNATLRSRAKPTLTTQSIPTTSRSVAASPGEFGNTGPPTRTDHRRKTNRLVDRIAAKCHDQGHWSEGLEPYEGKLSSTVLRGGRAGNSPLPLGIHSDLLRFGQPRHEAAIVNTYMEQVPIQREWRGESLNPSGYLTPWLPVRRGHGRIAPVRVAIWQQGRASCGWLSRVAA